MKGFEAANTLLPHVPQEFKDITLVVDAARQVF
jgi:hypothetical protein